MIRALKALKKELDAKSRFEEIDRDEEGRALIEMTVLNDDDFLSNFSVGNKPVISSEVAEFIEDGARAYPSQERLSIRLRSNCIDETEKVIYEAAFKEYYVRRYKENRRELLQNAVASLIMAIIGMVSLSVVLTYSFFEKRVVFFEAADIFAWVFLWEAVDLFFLERQTLRIKRKRFLSLIDAKLSFLPLKNDE